MTNHFAFTVNKMNPICYLSATEIVRKIQARELSVEHTVQAFLDQIKTHNPRINAITDIREEADILQEARQKDHQLRTGADLGTLYGLPMTVKDGFNVKGLINSNGHPLYKNNRVSEDAELVKRLKQAGAIIIGKTNLPLFSIDWQATNAWFGQTNNPYDVHRVAGGSSGGSAAAVAMGFTPLELGSDAGGSIRVPAHFCGICGIRTTEQALSNRGQFKFPGKPQGHRQLTVAGPMAKNVSDLLLVMPILWGSGQLVAEIPPVDYQASNWQGERLTIAYSTTLNRAEVDQEYEHIFTQFIQTIRGVGHRVEPNQPVYDEASAYNLHGRLLGFEIDTSSPTPWFLTKVAMYLFILLKYRDRPWAKGIAQGIGMSANRLAQTWSQKEEMSDIYTAFFERYDIWLTPVASFSAFRHQPAGVPFRVNEKQVGYTQAMASFNFTTALSGHPIVVIPIGQTSTGMPLGVQIHARKWSDKRLLEIAKHLETLTDGFQIPKQA